MVQRWLEGVGKGRGMERNDVCVFVVVVVGGITGWGGRAGAKRERCAGEGDGSGKGQGSGT